MRWIKFSWRRNRHRQCVEVFEFHLVMTKNTHESNESTKICSGWWKYTETLLQLWQGRTRRDGERMSLVWAQETFCDSRTFMDVILDPSILSADWRILVNWLYECSSGRSWMTFYGLISNEHWHNKNTIQKYHTRILKNVFQTSDVNYSRNIPLQFNRDTSRHPSRTLSIRDESWDDDRLRPFSDVSGESVSSREDCDDCTDGDVTTLTAPVLETEDSRGEISTIHKDELDIPSQSPENDTQRFDEQLEASLSAVSDVDVIAMLTENNELSVFSVAKYCPRSNLRSCRPSFFYTDFCSDCIVLQQYVDDLEMLWRDRRDHSHKTSFCEKFKKFTIWSRYGHPGHDPTHDSRRTYRL